MIRPLVWVVIWVDAIGRGLGTCGHRHVSDDDAMRCPWEPDSAPLVSAGLVRQVRDPAYVAPHLSDPAYLARLAARDGSPVSSAQLAMPWSAV